MSEPREPRTQPVVGPYVPTRSPRGTAPADEILAGLSDTAEATFLRAIGRLSSRPRDPASVSTFVTALVATLVAAPALTDRTRAERLTAVLRRLEPDPSAFAALAEAARAYPAGLRMAIAQALPPALRGLLAPTGARAASSGRPAAAGTPDNVGGAMEVRLPTPAHANVAADRDEALGVPRAAEQAPRAESAVDDASAAADGTLGMVAILSRPDRQESNKRLLNSARLAAVPWDSVDRFRAELATNADVCACVIDGSVLAELDEPAQRALFEYLGAYSSFLWIRVHDHGLKLDVPAVRELVKQARCARGTVAHVSIQGESQLRPGELPDFHHAADTLRAWAGTTFVPGELNDDQARVLVAAAREFWSGHHLAGDVKVRVLETRFLSGGRSGALLVRIRVNGTGQPLIAKIGPADEIATESRRVRTFVEQWDRAVHPETFRHGAWGVILFPIVAADRERDTPAGTLEERLAALWNDQVMGSGDGTPAGAWDARLRLRRDAMVTGLRTLTATLADFNRQRPAAIEPSGGFAPWGNPWLTPFARLDALGVRWLFTHDVAAARDRAQARLAHMAEHAVVHGDVHLRNVLLRSEHDATLIDFGSCGPGHPCVDLARLDVVLFTDGMRQLVGEGRCAEFQRALSIDRATAETLRADFGDLLTCHVNIVCAEGAVLARDAATMVLAAFGGTYEDYLAAKYLVASQALFTMGRSTGMARAIVDALTPAILAWPARHEC